MSCFKVIRAILEEEPETWLAYLHGQQLQNLPHLLRKKPRYRGFILQVAKFGATLLRGFSLKKQPELSHPAKFFVFAGTNNQMVSLEETIYSLVSKGEQVVAVVVSRLLTSEDEAKGYVPFQLTFMDVMRAVWLFVTRGFGLYRALRAKHPVSIDWHFATFCNVYPNLAYFYRVLSQVNPEFVITANDHNVPNRCMLAVAHHLGIKTVYLQHASVSNIFPALRVNYAFLDGQCALDTYRRCEANQPSTPRNVPIPEVILSGQKKHLKRGGGRQVRVIGIALNALDDPKAGMVFINALAAQGFNVRLRWHPGQAPRDTLQYRKDYTNSEGVSLSDPKQESISDFLGQIGWLIAGNSSIHLEAALAGVMPIYFEQTPPDQPDYYGYVKHGLTQAVSSVDDLLGLIERTNDRHTPDEDAVRYYSATYLTEWDGREGELVAECLMRLSTGKKVPVGAVEFVGGSERNIEVYKAVC